MKKNNGFTLVELIVAMLVATIVAAGMVLIFRLAIKQGRDTRIEAQLQVELNSVSDRLENDLKDAIVLDYKDNVLTLKSSKWNSTSQSIEPYYYYYIFRDNKLFVKSSSTALKDDAIVYEKDCLANYIDNFSISNNSINSEDKDYSPQQISFTISAEECGITYSVTRLVKMREGET